MVPLLALVISCFVGLALATANTGPTSLPLITPPSPAVQPPPNNLTSLFNLITSSAEGTQFQFINYLGFNLNVGHFLSHDNAPVISLTTNTTGLNSAFIFSIVSAGTPFLVTIQDATSGSYLSYALAGSGITYEFSPATINSNLKFATIFEVTPFSGDRFTLTEANGKNLLTVWPDAGNPFSPVTYQGLFNGTNALKQTWIFAPLCCSGSQYNRTCIYCSLLS